MPQYPQARMTARDRKLAQLQQLQQNDLQQQQADQQQQQAMLAQVSQLYGLQQAQQMDPVRMQAAELANQQAQYGLDRAQQFDPVQLQALQGGVEAQRYANSIAPEEFKMKQLANVSNIDSNSNATRMAQSRDAREQQLLQPQLQHLQNQNTIGQAQANWADTLANQEYQQNEARRALIQAQTVGAMNPGVQITAPDQALIHQGGDLGGNIKTQVQETQKRVIQNRIANGLNPDGSDPALQGQTQVSGTSDSPFLLQGLADILGAPMDFTNKLTNDLIAPPYDWLMQGVGSKNRFNRLPKSGGSNAVRRQFNLTPTE